MTQEYYSTDNGHKDTLNILQNTLPEHPSLYDPIGSPQRWNGQPMQSDEKIGGNHDTLNTPQLIHHPNMTTRRHVALDTPAPGSFEVLLQYANGLAVSMGGTPKEDLCAIFFYELKNEYYNAIRIERDDLLAFYKREITDWYRRNI